jgi:cytochrome c2
MPTFHFTEREITVLGQYFSKLDDVDWGWIDTTIQATPEELRAGQQLFDELKCISCHPTSANVKLEEGKAPAPSLSLAAKRLRPDWIVRWLEDPITIVPDTRMPTFFAVDQATGRRKTQVPNILGGDVDAQIRAIRNHVFTLGGGSVRGN